MQAFPQHALILTFLFYSYSFMEALEYTVCKAGRISKTVFKKKKSKT